MRLREHSLSIALGCGFVASNIAFFSVEPGHWYDAFSMLAGCFGGSLIFVLLARPLWEKGADPTKPPEAKP